MIRISNMLLEATIGKIVDKINVIMNLDKTYHAGERQSRHDDIYISNDDIMNTTNMVLSKIAKSLLFNYIDVGDYVLVTNTKNNLNIVGKLEEKGGMLNFIIVTVMVKKNFIPKGNTYQVKI